METCSFHHTGEPEVSEGGTLGDRITDQVTAAQVWKVKSSQLPPGYVPIDQRTKEGKREERLP